MGRVVGEGMKRGRDNEVLSVNAERPVKMHEEGGPELLFEGAEGLKWGPAGRWNR